LSKIGKKAIEIPIGVEVSLKTDGLLCVKGPKGEVMVNMRGGLIPRIGKQTITIDPPAGSLYKQLKSTWGTTAALVANAIEGVTKGFERRLEIEGVGLRASIDNGELVLQLGFSHLVRYVPSSNVNIRVEKNIIVVSGIDRAVVGQAAADIRSLKKPEPYKGKGIRYQGETIRRKAGKKATAAAS